MTTDTYVEIRTEEELGVELQIALQKCLMQFTQDHHKEIAKINPSLHAMMWVIGGSSTMSFIYENLDRVIADETASELQVTLNFAYNDKLKFLREKYPPQGNENASQDEQNV